MIKVLIKYDKCEYIFFEIFALKISAGAHPEKRLSPKFSKIDLNLFWEKNPNEYSKKLQI